MIEGHGGMLDRLDSVCFAAPQFFHLTRFFFSHGCARRVLGARGRQSSHDGRRGAAPVFGRLARMEQVRCTAGSGRRVVAGAALRRRCCWSAPGATVTRSRKE